MKKSIIAALILSSLLVLGACSKSNEPVQEQWEVTAILSPTGLGDMGYNDQTYLGLCYIREQLECDVIDRFPTNADEGIAMAKAWMQEKPVTGKHRLLVLCDESYSAAVRQTGWKNSEDNCVLQLDSDDSDLDIYTRSMPLYGACHAVGQICKETLAGTDKHAAVVLANPHDLSIKDGLEGFLEGARKAGVTVETHYLSNVAGAGYDKSEDLYHLCYDLSQTTGFVLPLAGGSNNGVYKYGREKHDAYIWTCALDSDLAYTSFSAAYGIMKYIDQLLLDFARNWINGQPNELHVVCGLASGYVKVEVNPYQNSWGADFDACLKAAIEQENKKL